MSETGSADSLELVHELFGGERFRKMAFRALHLAPHLVRLLPAGDENDGDVLSGIPGSADGSLIPVKFRITMSRR
jgi:hypothetical protein